MYEALRAYFVEDRSSAEAAKAFGYTPASPLVKTDPVLLVKTDPPAGSVAADRD